MSDLGVNLDRSSAPCAKDRLAAVQYLERTGNADVAEALGLVEDPVATAGREAKALRDITGVHTPKREAAREQGECA